jgi:conjugal transfer pilus assembly protein TraF
MRGLYRYFSIAVLIGLWIVPCLAQEDNFYGRRKEGWYWYKDGINKEAARDDETAVSNKRQPDHFTYQQLWDMDPDKLKVVLMDRQKLAMQQPTEQNVLSYLIAHEVIKGKSVAFSKVATRLSAQRMGLAKVAAKTGPVSKVNHDKADGILSENAGDFALLVFERSGCHYCEAQQPIVEQFSQAFGWTVKHLDIERYSQMASEYRIDITPSIIMLGRSAQRAVEISKGLVSFDELKELVLEGITLLTREIESVPAPEAEPGVWQKHLKVAVGRDRGDNP